jgi:pyruvate/2-oxoglutarate dehydrogenase complex dihydrolipoamide dehydrogenase (E3) component
MKEELFPEDKDASVLLQRKMIEDQGIVIFFKDKVKNIEKKNGNGAKEGSNNKNFDNYYDDGDDNNNNDNGLNLEYPHIVTHGTFNGSIERTEVDLVLYMTKRIPNIEGLNLEHIGIKYDKLGIKVNPYLQTNIPNIYAGGDRYYKETYYSCQFRWRICCDKHGKRQHKEAPRS